MVLNYTEKEIEEKIARWHLKDVPTQTLREYLGLTVEEYQALLHNKSIRRNPNEDF